MWNDGRIDDHCFSTILAVYIRNIRPENEMTTRSILEKPELQGIHTCLSADNFEAIQHSQKTGLIREGVLAVQGMQ
jgi:hypothetical protein